MHEAVPTSETIQRPLGEELARASRDMLEQVLTAISRRAYSPRIKLLDIHQLSDATGLAERTIYRLMEDDQFPKPQKNLGKNLWSESAIIAWIQRNNPNQEAKA